MLKLTVLIVQDVDLLMTVRECTIVFLVARMGVAEPNSKDAGLTHDGAFDPFD